MHACTRTHAHAHVHHMIPHHTSINTYQASADPPDLFVSQWSPPELLDHVNSLLADPVVYAKKGGFPRLVSRTMYEAGEKTPFACTPPLERVLFSRHPAIDTLLGSDADADRRCIDDVIAMTHHCTPL